MGITLPFTGSARKQSSHRDYLISGSEPKTGTHQRNTEAFWGLKLLLDQLSSFYLAEVRKVSTH